MGDARDALLSGSAEAPDSEPGRTPGSGGGRIDASNALAAFTRYDGRAGGRARRVLLRPGPILGASTLARAIGGC
jgi:hypothetical protein